MKQFFLAIVCVLALTSCEQQGGQVYVNSPNVVVTPETTNLGDNLNLQALGELVKTSTTAQDIESKLNQPNSINNLDLDNDGKVDYVKVTEYGSGDKKGFSFTVDMPSGQSQEVATVELQSSANQQATMNINGNQTVYGNNASYASNFTMTDLLIYHYLFFPHPYYVSPWRYGYYPSYYHTYVPVSRGYYGNRIGSTTKTTRITRTTTSVPSSSPNRNLSSSVVSSRAKSLTSPTTSQRSFTTTSSSASKPSTSWFKSSSTPSTTTSRPSSSSWFSSSPSRSSSSGSSSRSSSSGSSSRSSSSGSSSRSSSFGSSRRR